MASVDKRRQRENLSWRRVASAVGIEQSTLNRIVHGARPSTTNYLKLVSWAGESSHTFVKRPESERPALHYEPIMNPSANPPELLAAFDQLSLDFSALSVLSRLPDDFLALRSALLATVASRTEAGRSATERNSHLQLADFFDAIAAAMGGGLAARAAIGMVAELPASQTAALAQDIRAEAGHSPDEATIVDAFFKYPALREGAGAIYLRRLFLENDRQAAQQLSNWLLRRDV